MSVVPDIIHNWIGGVPVPARSGATRAVTDPATGAEFARMPDSGPADVAAAVAAAQAALDEWRSHSAAERAAILERLGALVERDLPRLAHLECVDSGKPLALARSVEIPRAAANLRFFGELVRSWDPQERWQMPGAQSVVQRRAGGVAGCISPWNLPLYLFTWKIAPALAAGCTVVAKPSEETPMTAAALGALSAEAGMPRGVLNIVQGTGAGCGAAIVEHPGIPILTFTGGTATGERIMRSAGPLFKRVALELGGKNPAIVFADCDFDATLEALLRASFQNQGQICLCASRILIERPLYARLRDALTARASALRVGDPMQESTEQGALVSGAHLAKVRAAAELARSEGGRILCGGRTPEVASLPDRVRGGAFFQPTMLEGLPMDSRTNQEEIFGPVITLQPFDDESQAVALANQSQYGLAATVWTRDEQRAMRVAHALECGIVWLNSWLVRDLRVPFGGVKRSGVGREGGIEALQFFCEPKSITWKTP